jgi:branched-chain amino acid transport system ATP-binding protein
MLQVKNIEVKYSDVILALKGVSFQIPDGQLITLVGSNGAGKSTTLKAISGLLKSELGEVTEGEILWAEGKIENGDPEKTARMGIIQVQEGRKIFEHLTTEENLRVGANIRGARGAEMTRSLDKVFEYFPKLRDLRRNVSGYLSGGEQQMLVIGRALMADPKLLLLDEPSIGLSPALVKEVFSIIKRLNDESKLSILLVEQNVKASLGIAAYGYILENGRIVLDGPAEKLSCNEDVKEFYMGMSKSGERRRYSEIKHYKRRKRWLG